MSEGKAPDGRDDLPSRFYILRDHKGNTVQVDRDIDFETAFRKLSESYPLELHTYVRQPVKMISRAD